MKFITEKNNNQVLEKIRKEGWDNYYICDSKEISNEPIVVKISGSIEDYAKRNGYINAIEAMKILQRGRKH